MGRRSKLTVQKKGHTRKSHSRKGYWRTDGRTGKRVWVPPSIIKETYVNPSKYKIKDKGLKGRGQKVIKGIKKGKMTDSAKEFGYIDDKGMIMDIPDDKMDDFALELAKKYNPEEAFKMFLAQYVFRINSTDEKVIQFRNKMEIGMNAISDKYDKELAPTEAIERWKSMTPKERKESRNKTKTEYNPTKTIVMESR